MGLHFRYDDISMAGTGSDGAASSSGDRTAAAASGAANDHSEIRGSVNMFEFLTIYYHSETCKQEETHDSELGRHTICFGEFIRMHC